MIQITPQLRILVAVKAVDGRKGVRFPCTAVPGEIELRSVFRLPVHLPHRSARAIRIVAYDGQGFWLATKRLSKGRFRWWPTGAEASRSSARASGAVAAGGRQSGYRSRASMAACERMKNELPPGSYVPVSVLPQ